MKWKAASVMLCRWQKYSGLLYKWKPLKWKYDFYSSNIPPEHTYLKEYINLLTCEIVNFVVKFSEKAILRLLL
jgi:hypothetical protein